MLLSPCYKKHSKVKLTHKPQHLTMEWSEKKHKYATGTTRAKGQAGAHTAFKTNCWKDVSHWKDTRMTTEQSKGELPSYTIRWTVMPLKRKRVWVCFFSPGEGGGVGRVEFCFHRLCLKCQWPGATQKLETQVWRYGEKSSGQDSNEGIDLYTVTRE